MSSSHPDHHSNHPVVVHRGYLVDDVSDTSISRGKKLVEYRRWMKMHGAPDIDRRPKTTYYSARKVNTGDEEDHGITRASIESHATSILEERTIGIGALEDNILELMRASQNYDVMRNLLMDYRVAITIVDIQFKDIDDDLKAIGISVQPDIIFAHQIMVNGIKRISILLAYLRHGCGERILEIAWKIFNNDARIISVSVIQKIIVAVHRYGYAAIYIKDEIKNLSEEINRISTIPQSIRAHYKQTLNDIAVKVGAISTTLLKYFTFSDSADDSDVSNV